MKFLQFRNFISQNVKMKDLDVENDYIWYIYMKQKKKSYVSDFLDI